mmetsp:Transcript_11472/g.18088  ORF Transcript_11472/g.18088 Transcript_11472/m.18088 type:complete len:165 (-) Transcript_11472:31-525(-)
MRITVSLLACWIHGQMVCASSSSEWRRQADRDRIHLSTSRGTATSLKALAATLLASHREAASAQSRGDASIEILFAKGDFIADEDYQPVSLHPQSQVIDLTGDPAMLPLTRTVDGRVRGGIRLRWSSGRDSGSLDLEDEANLYRTIADVGIHNGCTVEMLWGRK